MKLWMSAEISGGIGEPVRHALNFVEDEINAKIADKDYDIELDKWRCIAILMKDKADQERYSEVIKYSTKTKKWILNYKLTILSLSMEMPSVSNGLFMTCSCVV